MKTKPPTIKIISNKLRSTFRHTSASLRTLPDFLIIGAAKSGTTSLYNYLIQHPDVHPCYQKEVHYFDYYFHKGLNWYKSFFPYKSEMVNQTGKKKITGESSPYYLYHPLSPQRVAETLPGSKLVCVLRNPVDRAVSNYNHMFREGLETLSIEEAFEKEPERIAGEEEKLIKDPIYSSNVHFRHSYLARGIYFDQLVRWLKYFSSESITILNSEEFYQNTPRVFETVVKALGLPACDTIRFKVYNSGGDQYVNIDPSLRKKLIDYFKPHNEKLFDLLGVKYDWDK